MVPVCRLVRSDFRFEKIYQTDTEEVTSYQTVKIWVAYFIKCKIQ